MRLIEIFDDAFGDCVAYFEFDAADSGDGFEFTLVRARARPLVDGVRPTLIAPQDWLLPLGDPLRNVFEVVNGPATEDITDEANSGDGTTHIRLPPLGAGMVLPIWIRITLTGAISFLGDDTPEDWEPILSDGFGNPRDPGFISYCMVENFGDGAGADRVDLRYESVPDGRVGFFDLCPRVPRPIDRPSGSSIHNSPPG